MKYTELRDKVNEAIEARRTFLPIENEEFEGLKAGPHFKILPLHIRFYRCKFLGDLHLDEVVFPQGASFVDADFCGEVRFSSCHFNGPAYFWKCRFHKLADFSHTVVHKANFEGGKQYPGETNFSYSEFKAKADFRHAVFNGPAYFHRTVFGSHVDFEVARFEAAAIFVGMVQDICIADRELPEGVAKRLSDPAAKILVKCEDRAEGYYNFDLTITSPHELQKRLGVRLPKWQPFLRMIPSFSRRKAARVPTEPLLDETVRKAVIELWSGYAKKYMFNNAGCAINFMEASFGEASWFRHVSLRRCQFRRADLANAQFDGVQWEQGWTMWMRRWQVYDELWLNQELRKLSWKHRLSRTECGWAYEEGMAISRVYHQLRSVADTAGERGLARNFYYGEMEMGRRAEPWPFRSLLAFLYKVLSGYGTRENMALTILLFLMFVFFPVTYHYLDIRSGINPKRTGLATETTSLEASTFFLRPAGLPGFVPDVKERFVESVERIFISIQAGLFVLSLKSRFQRGPD